MMYNHMIMSHDIENDHLMLCVCLGPTGAGEEKVAAAERESLSASSGGGAGGRQEEEEGGGGERGEGGREPQGQGEGSEEKGQCGHEEKEEEMNTF